MGKKGFVFLPKGFDEVVRNLGKKYRIYAPVLKVGEGRFTDTDVVRYDFIKEAAEIELEKKSDYSFKEILTPLSQTLFFFTENEVKEADQDISEVIVFLRSCDLNALKRLDQIYLHNGRDEDYFYARIRDNVKFALIGCAHSYEDCFCVDMNTNRADDTDYLFSVDLIDNRFHCQLKEESLEEVFANNAEENPNYQREGGDWINFKIPNSELSIPMIQSGFGDGRYPVYFGYDENGELCDLVVEYIYLV